MFISSSTETSHYAVHLQAVLLLPVLFLALESTRAILWAARVANAEEADDEGPLLRTLCAGLINVLGMIPSPVWRVITYVAWIACVPVRGVLWLWGIGRGRGPGSNQKKGAFGAGCDVGVVIRSFVLMLGSPRAVTRWYVSTRARRAETIRRRRRREHGDSL